MGRTHAEQILADLVAIPSITESSQANNEALDYIGTYLQDQGMYVERLSYTESVGDRPPTEYGALVATTTPTKTPKVMLSAHVDVVPADAKHFKLRQQGDKLLGRGVADMKGSIAAFMALTRSLRGQLNKYDFGITIVTNEEIGGKGVENTLKDGFLPEAVILPDNGKNWQLEKVAKGAWTIVIEAPGVAAHGARPWDGDSASFRLLDVLGDVRDLFKGQGLDTDTLNISMLSAGEVQNQVPARATATLDIRLMGHQNRRRMQETIEELCAKHGVSYRLLAEFPPLEHNMADPYLQAFKQSLAAVRASDDGESISTGACDASYYDKYGIPTIVIQAAGGDEHADTEWLSRKALQELIKVLGHFIKATCKMA